MTNQPNIFQTAIHERVRVLQAQFDAASLFGSPGVVGTVRERAFEAFLRALLPEKYQLGTGHVFDSRGGQSYQQDIVLYDEESSPVLFKDGPAFLFPVESVYGAIEVKSRLNKAELGDAVHKVKSLKRLVRNDGSVPFGAVFAYSSTWRASRTVGKQLASLNKTVQPKETVDIICIHNPPALVAYEDARGGYPGLIQLYSYDQRRVWTFDTHEPEAFFYLLLMNILVGAKITPPDLQQYVSLPNVGLKTTWKE